MQGGDELLPRMNANKDAKGRWLEAENYALPFDAGLEDDEQGQV